MRTFGRGRRAGFGSMTAFLNVIPSASPVTASSVQKRSRTARFRSKIRPRCANGTPTASNSRSYQPAATPSTSRPPHTWSRDDVTFARTTGLRRGSTRTPVPSSTRSVTAASAASVESDSRNGKGFFEPSMTWSHAHSESKPRLSALPA